MHVRGKFETPNRESQDPSASSQRVSVLSPQGDAVTLDTSNSPCSPSQTSDLPMFARFLYLVLTLATMFAGFSSRRYAPLLPPFLAKYSGDTLWAMMVFWGVSFLSPKTSRLGRAAVALTFAYAIEFSQLYHAPWIDSLRATWPGRLILGRGFLWSDLNCYCVGILVAFFIDRLIRPQRHSAILK